MPSFKTAITLLVSIVLIDHVARVSALPRPFTPVFWICQKTVELSDQAMRLLSDVWDQIKDVVLVPFSWLWDYCLLPLWTHLWAGVTFIAAAMGDIISPKELAVTGSQYIIALGSVMLIPVRWILWWGLGVDESYLLDHPVPVVVLVVLIGVLLLECLARLLSSDEDYVYWTGSDVVDRSAYEATAPNTGESLNSDINTARSDLVSRRSSPKNPEYFEGKRRRRLPNMYTS